jgi:hypothetical protein
VAYIASPIRTGKTRPRDRVSRVAVLRCRVNTLAFAFLLFYPFVFFSAGYKHAATRRAQFVTETPKTMGIIQCTIKTPHLTTQITNPVQVQVQVQTKPKQSEAIEAIEDTQSKTTGYIKPPPSILLASGRLPSSPAATFTWSPRLSLLFFSMTINVSTRMSRSRVQDGWMRRQGLNWPLKTPLATCDGLSS